MSQEQKEKTTHDGRRKTEANRTASERTQKKKTSAGDDHACCSSWCVDRDPDRIHRTGVCSGAPFKKRKSGRKSETGETDPGGRGKNKQRKESIDQAEVMAQGYDYDGAIELLKSG